MINYNEWSTQITRSEPNDVDLYLIDIKSELKVKLDKGVKIYVVRTVIPTNKEEEDSLIKNHQEEILEKLKG